MNRWIQVKWIALVILLLASRVFPDLLERYQEAIVGLVGGLIWYYHSRPRVVAHLRVTGRTLPIIDIENIGNRAAKNMIVELLPRDFCFWWVRSDKTGGTDWRYAAWLYTGD